MSEFGSKAAWAAAIGLAMSCAAPAAAQSGGNGGNARTWVSAYGDDTNPCTPTGPCKTFAGAYDKTVAGGEINCLDPSGFGQLVITKSITILCDYLEAGVLVSSVDGIPGNNDGITINGSGIIVELAGFDLEGLRNAGSASVNGITIVNAAMVTVRNSKVRGFTKGYGIRFAPAAGTSNLILDHVAVAENGAAAYPASGGIAVLPGTDATAQLTVLDSRVTNNANVGIRLETTGAARATITATVARTDIVNNVSGLMAKAPRDTGAINFLLRDSNVTLNSTYGVVTNAGTAGALTGRVADTAITANGTGVLHAGTSVLASYGSNLVGGNGVDGSFSTPGLVPQ
ncbi:hypothetical protein [Sphingomonas sp.]|uniref:hypothetical protein n=1 Tax=Sphingomonas sp. TaxID=28214 RepID=UPI001B28B72C|nr:hypothetical protein [Sphingomonas sp.]MBO9714076.1 hypothetical protein [Sphingomonas sp.]